MVYWGGGEGDSEGEGGRGEGEWRVVEGKDIIYQEQHPTTSINIHCQPSNNIG